MAVAPGATVLANVLLLLRVVLFDVILEEQFTEESLGAYFALVVQLLCVLCGNVPLEKVERVGLVAVRTLNFHVNGSDVRLHLGNGTVSVLAFGTLFGIVQIDFHFHILGKMLSPA